MEECRRCREFDVNFEQGGDEFNVGFEQGGDEFSADFGEMQIIPIGEHYTGETVVTPAQEIQTLQTRDKVVDVDIIIEPIPSNYGLITWNGAVLTVS